MATPTFFVVDGNPRHPAQVIGYLAEKNSLNQRLIFHWNPTSFKFKKTAEYDSIGTNNFYIESLTPKLSKAIECTFELFLNEWDQPRAIQQSVEASIGWLVQRMGPSRTPRGTNWLDAASRAVQAGGGSPVPAPVLVLVGLRDVFTCVLTDLEITSTIQRPNVPSRNAQTSTTNQALLATATTGQKIKAAALARTAGGGTAPFNTNYALRTTPKPGDLVRATLQVTLKEWVPSPI